MRVGILTFQFADNYGAVLQAFALKRAIESENHEVEIVDYYPKHFKKLYSLNPFLVLPDIRWFVKKCLRFPYRIIQRKRFEEFRDIYLNLTKECVGKAQTEKIAEKYDLIVFGSDQIWNTDIVGNDNVYFGCLGEGKKKIAYAASLGTKVLKEEQKVLFDENLRRFERISVREKSGQDLLYEQFGGHAEVVCDPVFLLKKEEWEDIAGRSRISLEKKYIVYYSLSNGKNERLDEAVTLLAEQRRLPVMMIHPINHKIEREGRQLFHVGPLEFLELIRKAEVICTDSFHAFAFSVLYEKEMMIFPLDRLDARIVGLEELLGGRQLFEDKGYPLVVSGSALNKEELIKLINQSKGFLKNIK